MKALLQFFLFFGLCQVALAESPYETLDSSYRDSGSITEITPSTPIKAQDGVGLCYGFSATSLLENFRCREMNLDCSNEGDVLSSLDVTSYYQKQSLKEGGDTFRLLDNIERSKRKIAKEQCVKFSALVFQMSSERHSSRVLTLDEKSGWNFLIKKWNEYKGIGQSTARNDCVSCLADTIKATLVNIETPKDQLQDAFQSARTLEEFLYKSLLPKECLEDSETLSIPAFKTKTFPGYKDTANNDSITRKVVSILQAGLPLEMSICTRDGLNGKCDDNGGHSIALFGIKEVCSSKNNDCKKVVKIKNSYGKSWQEYHNDGWVDLDSLVESSLLFGKGNNITWLEKPGFILPVNNPAKSNQINAPSIHSNPGRSIPNQYKNYKGIWKCPGSKFSDIYEAGCVPLK